MQLKLGQDTIYFRIHGTDYAPSQCTIPEGNYSTVTLAAALCKAMDDNYPFTGPTSGTTPTRFILTANLSNSNIVISNPTDTFKIFTDVQDIAFHVWKHISYENTCMLS